MKPDDQSAEELAWAEAGEALHAALEQKKALRPHTYVTRTGEFHLPPGETFEHVQLRGDVFYPPKHSDGVADGAPQDPFPGEYRLVHFEVMEMNHAIAVSHAEDAVQEVWREVNPDSVIFSFDESGDYANPYGHLMTPTEGQERIAQVMTATLNAVRKAMPKVYDAAFVECNGKVLEIPKVTEDIRYARIVHEIGIRMLTAESSDELEAISSTALATPEIIQQLADHFGKRELFELAD